MFSLGIADLLTLVVALFGIFLIMLALIPVALVLLARSAYRRVRRDPRWNRRALVMQEKTTASGPRRGLFQLRVRLGDAIGSAKEAVKVLQTHGGVQGELASLVRRLDQVAATLDAQLRLMQSEPDMRLLNEMIAPARARVEEIEGTVRHVRNAAYAAIGGDMEGTVAAITADVEREVAALQAGVQMLRTMAIDAPQPLRVPIRKESY